LFDRKKFVWGGVGEGNRMGWGGGGGEMMKAGSRVFLSVTMVLMIGMLSASGVI